MRTTKELLQIMLDNIDEMVFGLCGLVSLLRTRGIITLHEYFRLKHYLEDNRPPELYGSAYWWKIGVKKPRIKWLKKQIKLNAKA